MSVDGRQVRSADRWLDAEWLRLCSQRPGVARSGRYVLRHRVAVLVLFGATMAVAVDAIIGSDNDLHEFVGAAHILVSSHPFDALSSPSVQVGPLALLFIQVLGWLGSLAGVSAAIAATAGLGALATYGALRVASSDRHLAHRSAVMRDFGVGICVALGPLATAALFGQIPEVLVAVGLVGVGQLAQRRRDVAAGTLLGLCVGLKLWALLGIPVLLFAATPRGLARRGAAFAAVVAATYAPFFLFGRVNTFHYRWTVDPESALGVLDGGADFDWRLRLAQAVVVCSMGVLLVRLRGAQPWLVVAGVVAVRLLTDPGRFAYYGTALAVCLLVGLWPRYAHRWAWFGPCAVAASVLTTVGDYLMTGSFHGVPRDVALVLTLAYVLRLSVARPATPAIVSDQGPTRGPEQTSLKITAEGAGVASRP